MAWIGRLLFVPDATGLFSTSQDRLKKIDDETGIPQRPHEETHDF